MRYQIAEVDGRRKRVRVVLSRRVRRIAFRRPDPMVRRVVLPSLSPVDAPGQEERGVGPAAPVTVEGPDDRAERPSPETGVPAWLAGRYLWGVILLALLYYGVAKVGYAFGYAGPIAAIVWLPVGVGAAFLTIGGLSFWPGALIGDLLANDYSAIPFWGAIGQTIGNLLEVVVIALVVRRLMRRRPPLESLGGVAGMLAGIAAGTAVSAIVGPLSLAGSGGLSIGAVPHVSWTWWLGDTCGALLVLPLALAWNQRVHVQVTRRRAFEAFAILALVGGLSWIAARGLSPAYVIFPVLALAALRFGWRGATSAVFVSVAFVVWGETDLNGQFRVHEFARSVLETQLFIVVAVISSLFWTALVAERENAVQEMRASEVRAFSAAETERRRMERDLHDGAQQRLLALAVRLGLRARQATAPALQRFFAEGEAQLHEAIDELRDLSHGIHPSVLSELGLANATRSLAGRSPIPVTLLELPTRPAPADAQAAAYYALTEVLANAQKHSGASSIRLRLSSDSAALRLVVEDDGVGGATESVGSGLTGIRRRVEALGGSFVLESPPGIGTRITAVIPARAT
jgi:signal transduction histidine kinase